MPNETIARLSQSDSGNVDEDDYQSFCQTLGLSARGRAFLAEFARRNRHAETQVVLTALARLERATHSQEAAHDAERMRQDLRGLLNTLTGAKPQVDNSPGAIKAATLSALVDFVQARIEALIAPARAPLAQVPTPDQPELPIPQPVSAAPTVLALVQAAIAAPSSRFDGLNKAQGNQATGRNAAYEFDRPAPLFGEDFNVPAAVYGGGMPAIDFVFPSQVNDSAAPAKAVEVKPIPVPNPVESPAPSARGDAAAGEAASKPSEAVAPKATPAQAAMPEVAASAPADSEFEPTAVEAAADDQSDPIANIKAELLARVHNTAKAKGPSEELAAPRSDDELDTDAETTTQASLQPAKQSGMATPSPIDAVEAGASASQPEAAAPSARPTAIAALAAMLGGNQPAPVDTPATAPTTSEANSEPLEEIMALSEEERQALFT